MVSERASKSKLVVPTGHACFASHFPGQPLVPGALLLQWVCQQALQQFPQHRMVEVPSMKFFRPLLPGDVCELTLRYDQPVRLVRVGLDRAGESVCQGVLDLRPEGAESQ
jgi:3-hydroxymyristoyl/3-hydroxydecanoyl-(acyl carrier protein) dehydratase